MADLDMSNSPLDQLGRPDADELVEAPVVTSSSTTTTSSAADNTGTVTSEAPGVTGTGLGVPPQYAPKDGQYVVEIRNYDQGPDGTGTEMM